MSDPSHVFQRARACNNIRFGSENRKTKSSSFSTRAVYFSELELAEIYGSGQKTGKQYHFDSGPARLREGPGRRVSFWGLPERGLPDLKEIYRGLFGWDLQGYRGRADQVVVSQVTCVLSVLHSDRLMCDRRRSTGSPSSMSELVRRQFPVF